MRDLLAIFLCGGVRIERANAPVTGLASRKAEALLAYLVCTRRPHSREKLATLLWDDRPQAQALGNLSVLLTSLRQRLAPFLTITRQNVAFNLDSDHSLDTAEFEQRIREARAEQPRYNQGQGGLSRQVATQLAQALALYQGDFLAGFYIRDAREFEEWALLERERLQRLAVEALADLVSFYRERGKYEPGIELATRWLTLEPLQEDAYRQLMQLLALAGRRGEALAQYEACRRILAQELDVAPDKLTTLLYEEIKAGGRGDGEKPKKVLLPVRTHNLQEQATLFIGREAELRQIQQRLDDPASRLLTLVGPGGIGKTRLALRAASGKVGEFQHGVWFVPLAGLLAPIFLPLAIGDALGFTFSGSSHSKVELLYYLHNKEMLLVLDNFEHLLDGASMVADIVRRAPQVKLLVTSRERLNLQAEWLLEIEGLPYPQSNQLENAAGYDAVQLFVQSALRVDGRLALTAETQPAVSRICQLVAGIPLGIELAASFVRHYHPTEIATTLEHNLDLLTTTWRDLPERHRSLRAVFDHSWQLLSPKEQQVLAQMSIFRGEFSREAALAVTETTPAELISLVDKSLLRRLPAGRYAVHELVQQFSAEKLAQRQLLAEDMTQERHSRFYMHFMSQRETAIASGSRQAIAEMRAEFENVQQAWQWAVQQGQIAIIEQGLAGLSHYYELAGLLQEGEATFVAAAEQVQMLLTSNNQPAEPIRLVWARLLAELTRLLNGQAKYDQAIEVARAALQQSQAIPDSYSQMIARLQMGIALYRQAGYPAAQTELERALSLARSEQLPHIEAGSLLNLGIVAWYQGDYAGANSYYEQCLRLFDKLQDGLGKSKALRNLGNVSWSLGEYGQARAYYERSLSLCREMGNRPDEGRALGNLGIVCLPQGDYAAARNYFEQSLHLFQQVGNRLDESKALSHLGDLGLHEGNYDQARDYYEQCVCICHEIGDQQGEAGRLSTLGLLFHLMGDNQQAGEYSQRALQLAQSIGDLNNQADALTHLGYALADQNQPAEAEAVYRQALQLRRELGEHHRAIEPLAGLAQVALERGDITQAQSQVEEILNYLEGNSLDALEQPFRIYLTCYHILNATSNSRAAAVLEDAYTRLGERAAKIGNEETRRSFLLNVATHRKIMSLRQLTHLSGTKRGDTL